jgi:hypothetical protein
MALGKQITEFTLKATSLTYSAEPGGSLSVQANVEGTATGFGAVLGTMTTTSANGKSGTWRWCGAAYLENGETLTGNGQGTFDSSGPHKWRTTGIQRLSDGRVTAIEGEITLATRTWSGKLYEWS